MGMTGVDGISIGDSGTRGGGGASRRTGTRERVAGGGRETLVLRGAREAAGSRICKMLPMAFDASTNKTASHRLFETPRTINSRSDAREPSFQGSRAPLVCWRDAERARSAALRTGKYEGK